MKINQLVPIVLTIGSCAPTIDESNEKEFGGDSRGVSIFSVKDASLGFKLVIGDAAEWAASEGVNSYSDAMSSAYSGDVEKLKEVISITRKLEWDAAGAVSHGSGLQMILAAVGDVTMANVISESRFQRNDRSKFKALLFPQFTNTSLRPMDLFPRTWKSLGD